MDISRLIKRYHRKLKSIHWVYLMLHIVLLVLGLFLIMLQNTICFMVGGSIIAGAIAGLALFLHVWLKEDEFHRMEIIRKFGFIEAFEHRSIRIKQEYDIRLDHVREAIDIMGFGLQALKEDYHEDFATWTAKAKVRILLLDPEFPQAEWTVANQRDMEEKNDQGDINRDVHAFIRTCANLLEKGNSNFEIRLYHCLPSINIFRIDDCLFWGPYLIADVSRNFPTFLLDQQGILYQRLLKHFNEIWSNNKFSRAVPNEWIEPDFPKSAS